MARRTKEDAAATRELLLDAAEREFCERGASRTSLAEVASAAGVTRGAVYWHFRDKSDLFSAMCARAKLPAGEYNCQVTVLDPTGQKAAFWQAPVMLVP